MRSDVPVDNPLSAREKMRLAELEGVIRENFMGFVAVGLALAEIRERRLYRTEQGRTFDAYCREIWEMQRMYAHRLISAAKTVENVSNWIQNNPQLPEITLPQNEAQARELARLDSEEQCRVWLKVVEEAKEGKPITARRIRNTIKERHGELFEKAKREIERRSDGTRKNGIRRSKEMRQVWWAFWEQVDRERLANWRHTSRRALFDDIRRLLELVGCANQDELEEAGCAMELADREKLRQAGFRIFRMQPARLLIEEWQGRDDWAVVEECDTPQHLSNRFRALLLDHHHLRA